MSGAEIIHGDCLAVLPTLEANGVHSVVTDPPYHLAGIVKRFGGANAAPVKSGDAYARASRGFMGKQWDGGDVAFRPETWAEVLRVLKPGGHLLAFGGTRGFHRMVCAIEDAGFEIRDSVLWLYGSGFPKNQNVSKMMDKSAGVEREVIGKRANIHSRGDHRLNDGWKRPWMDDPVAVGRSMMETAPATDAAREWDGWGTALKPSHEPICLARKPLSERTIAANVLRWGTGAINIDACRIETDGVRPHRISHSDPTKNVYTGRINGSHAAGETTTGRWPANVCHDGSPEVLAAFPDVGAAPPIGSMGGGSNKRSIYGDFGGERHSNGYGNAGSAARFFYCAKADKDDRAGSRHPTVKPISLISWLVKLITPPGGTVLDPFAGSGTTLEAARAEGFHAVGIEREAAYVADIRRRLDRAHGADTPLFAAASPRSEPPHPDLFAAVSA